VEERRLHLREGCSSLFTYCTGVLAMDEGAAYKRIHAARAVAKFPALRDEVAAGRLHLSAVVLLAPKLTAQNQDELICATRGKSKRAVEELLAARFPLADAPTTLRRLPRGSAAQGDAPAARTAPALSFDVPCSEVRHPAPPQAPAPAAQPSAPASPPATPSPAPWTARVEPLAAERFKLTVTISRELRDKLQQAQELLRHQNPTGDLAAIVDRAVTMLVDDVQKRRFGLGARPRGSRNKGTARSARSRSVPASEKREVARRDELQCAYVSPDGRRCAERGMLQIHHDTPHARGGPGIATNLHLRCAAHNAYQAEQDFGRAFVQGKVAQRRGAAPGESSAPT
jgi:hypothetical protein